ncbi:PLP-dependent aminotransferase family protein [Arcobacter sp. YIC-464]|uniref:MocR-like pyridoxine biosynthesis transcription factor PdxR n=1 Tax=Arcobacter sp. YIC-464 TaxID=3376631 RepID=UPI003C1575BA
MYKIEQKNKKPLHIQLYEEIKKDITENYKVNDKLPSIRKISTAYNLSKNTVENAYSQLVVEGYIESIPKSGFKVIENHYINISENISYKNDEKEVENHILYDFYPACLQKENFPLKLWKRLFNKNINESLDLGNYPHKQGEYKLREEISKYLKESRAVNCNTEQIIVSNGFISSMSLLCMILKNHKLLAIENPGYYIANKVFENHNFKIDKIDVNSNGIDINKLENSKAKLLYITPSHQYPTGVAIPITNRLKLLEWSKNNDSYIIEDDYDSELSYINRPIPSLQGLDNNQKVIYVGTFSKALSPALRVSYIVLPEPLLQIYKKEFFYYDSGVCLITQKTLEEFLAQGYWDKHLRKIRTLNKKKHNLMKELLEKKLKNSMKIISQGAGLSILIQATKEFDYEKAEKLAKINGIKIYNSKMRSGGALEGFMMGFGSIKEEELEKAINAFSNVWFKCFK